MAPHRVRKRGPALPGTGSGSSPAGKAETVDVAVALPAPTGPESIP